MCQVVDTGRLGPLLERLTILWNVAEALIAVGAGLLAGSIALVGFGLDSVIETIAALALYRRLRAEQAGATEEEAEDHERRALWVVGVTFLLLSAYIAFEAVITLWTKEPPDVSRVGLILGQNLISEGVYDFASTAMRFRFGWDSFPSCPIQNTYRVRGNKTGDRTG